MRYFAAFFLCLCISFNSVIAQNGIMYLNNYDKFVISPKNKFYEHNEVLEEVILEHLKRSQIPAPVNQSIFSTAEGASCDILKVVYSVENRTDLGAELYANISFVDCNFETVFQLNRDEKYGFYSKKNVEKTFRRLMEPFLNYMYVYNPPPEPEPEPEIAENKDGISVTIEGKPKSIKETTYSKETTTTTEIKYRGNVDPLKGLNVGEAKREIEIGNYYALIIGIDKYRGSWTPLNNAVRDAKTVANTLQEKYVFHHFRTLYNENATRANIIQEFEWLMRNVKPTDNIFIYYSGHGDFQEALNKGFWVPYDATSMSVAGYISNSDIKTFLGGINSKHTLLVADACFSGDLFRGKTMTIPYENNTKYYNKVHNLSSRKAISSGGVEPVMDGGRDGHSVFAYYLLKALNGNDKNFLDASEIYDQIKIPIVNNSEQTPNFNPIKNTGDEGGQFIFIKK